MKNYLFLLTLLLLFSACRNEVEPTDSHKENAENASANTQQEADVPKEEKNSPKTKPVYSLYELDQENNDLSYTSIEKALDAVPLIESDFAFLRTFVSPNSGAEIYSDQEKLKAIRLPDSFFDLQDVVVKEYDGDFLGTVFGGNTTTLKGKRENALKGGDRFERNVDYNIDLYAKFKLASGELIYLGTVNEYTEKGLSKRDWHIFHLNKDQQIVSASSFFFSLYYAEGMMASTYFFASNEEPDYFSFKMKDGYIHRIAEKTKPAFIEAIDVARKH